MSLKFAVMATLSTVSFALGCGVAQRGPSAGQSAGRQ